MIALSTMPSCTKITPRLRARSAVGPCERTRRAVNRGQAERQSAGRLRGDKGVPLKDHGEITRGDCAVITVRPEDITGRCCGSASPVRDEKQGKLIGRHGVGDGRGRDDELMTLRKMIFSMAQQAAQTSCQQGHRSQCGEVGKQGTRRAGALQRRGAGEQGSRVGEVR